MSEYKLSQKYLRLSLEDAILIRRKRERQQHIQSEKADRRWQGMKFILENS